MRRLHCFNCASDDVEYCADVLVGCCEHKSGEVWHCNKCGEDMVIQVVFSDDQGELNCPHESGEHGQCGNCKDCAKNN